MKLRHKTPCNDCPFRRESIAGFLGGTELEDWVAAWNVEGPFPCHKTVDAEMIPELHASAPQVTLHNPLLNDASFCAGALIMMRNSCKEARERNTRRAARQVEIDRVTVFHHIKQFEEHHSE